MAFDDDYRFKPDPMLLFEVPEDGEYVLAIADAIYRGREDFVYRITIGEMPVRDEHLSAGRPRGRAGGGRNGRLEPRRGEAAPPAGDAAPGIYSDRRPQPSGLVSNPLPFALDTLPECLDQEPNDDPAHAQKVQLPVIVNGRIDQTRRLGRVPDRRATRARRSSPRSSPGGSTPRWIRCSSSPTPTANCWP